MFIYKIRSTKTGEYSTGGTTPSFSKKGKTWTTRGHLSLHISQLTGDGKRIYRNHAVEIIELEVIETPSIIWDFDTYLNEVEEKKQKRIQTEQEKIEQLRKEIRRQQYEKLKKEFEE